jgi:hypothetical protein
MAAGVTSVLPQPQPVKSIAGSWEAVLPLPCSEGWLRRDQSKASKIRGHDPLSRQHLYHAFAPRSFSLCPAQSTSVIRDLQQWTIQVATKVSAVICASQRTNNATARGRSAVAAVSGGTEELACADTDPTQALVEHRQLLTKQRPNKES